MLECMFHEECYLVFPRYTNGRIGIELRTKDWGEPMATASVNVPEVPLEDDEVIIKNYSENEGILDCLIEAGVIEYTGRMIPLGFVVGYLCRLTEKAKQEVGWLI